MPTFIQLWLLPVILCGVSAGGWACLIYAITRISRRKAGRRTR